MAVTQIYNKNRWHRVAYIFFGLMVLVIMFYYLSNTIIHYTQDRQFPIDSFERFPLSWIIFPAEIFSFLFALYFVYVLITGNSYEGPKGKLKENPPVAILVPVYNEPIDIVERTLNACRKVRWKGGVRLYLLDDSDNNADMKNMDKLGAKFDAKVVRRTGRKGYKAGNINNAVKNHVREEFFAILDSDQAPDEDFLEKTMDFFSDYDVAFVQTPQNFIDVETPLEQAAKTGTNIFYRVQSLSKAKDGAIPFCGTNAIFRTEAFKEVKGLAYYTATEDIELGIRINEAGWKGAYYPKALVHGYAPKDFKAYSSQQYRWANGNLAILRESFFRILRGNFSFPYQVHMLFTVAWWIIGVITILYILVPVLALVFGWGTHHTWIPDAMIFFIYFHVLFGIFMIYVSLHGRLEGEKVKFRDAFLQYSLLVNSSFIYLRAAVNALLLKRYIGFIRTNKKASASGVGLIKWNLLFGVLCFVLGLYALFNTVTASTHTQLRTYLPLSIWLLFYSIILCSSIIFVGGVKNEN